MEYSSTIWNYKQLNEIRALNSFEKMFSIIYYLKNKKTARLQDISIDLGLAKSTTHRILNTLEGQRFVVKDEESKKYSLGLGFVDLGLDVLENLDIREAARPVLDELNDKTEETVHLALFTDDQVVYMDKRESRHVIRMYSVIGKVAPIHCTGVGKAALAFQDQETIGRVITAIELQKFTDNTITDRNRLLHELEEIRKRGYAIDREEHENHILCIAAPIRNHYSKVIASLSITTFLHRMDIEYLLQYKDLLLEKCFEISQNLGCKKYEQN